MIAVVLCASDGRPSGQQPQPAETAGPARPGWTFVPGVIAGAIYDSNVLVTTSITETGSPPSDTYFTIDPTGSLKYRGKLTTFDANYRGTLRRYTTLDGARRLRSARGGLLRSACDQAADVLRDQLLTRRPRPRMNSI